MMSLLQQLHLWGNKNKEIIYESGKFRIAGSEISIQTSKYRLQNSQYFSPPDCRNTQLESIQESTAFQALKNTLTYYLNFFFTLNMKIHHYTDVYHK